MKGRKKEKSIRSDSGYHSEAEIKSQYHGIWNPTLLACEKYDKGCQLQVHYGLPTESF